MDKTQIIESEAGASWRRIMHNQNPIEIIDNGRLDWGIEWTGKQYWICNPPGAISPVHTARTLENAVKWCKGKHIRYSIISTAPTGQASNR